MPDNKKSILKKILYSIAVILVVYLLSTLLGYTFLTHGVQAPYLLLIYLLGTVVVVFETSSFVATIFSSVLFITSHVFLFVEPRYSFVIHQKSFILTMVIFLMVAIFVNILVVRLKKQTKQSQREAQIHKELYQSIEGLLKIQERDKIIKFASHALSQIAMTDTQFLVDIPKDESNKAVSWCFRNSSPCGHGEAEFPDSDYKYIPIRLNRKTIGVVSIDCTLCEPDQVTMDAIHALINQLTLALQRCRLEEQAKKDASQYAREKIKGTVMKSLSHDMSPRVTTIRDLAQELRDETDLSKEEINQRLDVIVKEADYLFDTVDNILDITNK